MEIDKSNELDNTKIDYKKILLGTFKKMDLEPKYNALIKGSEIRKSKYDLIADYKKVISEKRKEEVIPGTHIMPRPVALALKAADSA